MLDGRWQLAVGACIRLPCYLRSWYLNYLEVKLSELELDKLFECRRFYEAFIKQHAARRSQRRLDLLELRAVCPAVGIKLKDFVKAFENGKRLIEK
jgi:hypothetical protein